MTATFTYFKQIIWLRAEIKYKNWQECKIPVLMFIICTLFIENWHLIVCKFMDNEQFLLVSKPVLKCFCSQAPSWTCCYVNPNTIQMSILYIVKHCQVQGSIQDSSAAYRDPACFWRRIREGKSHSEISFIIIFVLHKIIASNGYYFCKWSLRIQMQSNGLIWVMFRSLIRYSEVSEINLLLFLAN